MSCRARRCTDRNVIDDWARRLQCVIDQNVGHIEYTLL